MKRWMSLDIGQKRTGIAVTDELRIIATGLDTVRTHLIEQFIKDYLAKNDVEKVVVGMPLQMNNTPSESVKYIIPQVNRLKKVFAEIDFVYYDERFTSKIAHETMLVGGVKKEKRKNKEMVDKISAVLILQAYMDYEKHQM